MRLNLLLFISCVFFFTSCLEDVTPPDQEGMAPIYVNAFDFSLIVGEGPRESAQLGKLVLVQDRIYVNERNRGVHVIDNSNPNNPVKIGFIVIPGCNDFTVDGNFLYAGNGVNLITIDITELMNVKVTSHIPNFYLNEETNVTLAPPDYVGPFECVNQSLGAVVGWELKMLFSPRCFTR